MERKHYILYVYNEPCGKYHKRGEWLTRKTAQRHGDTVPDGTLRAIVRAYSAHCPACIHSGKLLDLLNGIYWR